MSQSYNRLGVGQFLAACIYSMCVYCDLARVSFLFLTLDSSPFAHSVLLIFPVAPFPPQDGVLREA